MKHNKMIIEQNIPIYQDYEQSEGDSQPMVQEVDEDYIPTQKEVYQYAIEVLGLQLPQDQKFLYLAREGLTAPLPPNWIPYQNRNGDVYYKHRITQEKMFEHPTDIEYRKKYQQAKEKMARKNLKSISKAPPIIGGKLVLDDIEPVSIQLDQKHVEQLQQLQAKLKLDQKEYEQQQLIRHKKKIKDLTQNHQNNLKNIIISNSQINSNYQLLNLEKQGISKKIKHAQQIKNQQQIQQMVMNHEKKIKETIQVLEQDNKIKINRYNELKQSQIQKYICELEIKKKQRENKWKQQKAKKAKILQIKLKQLQSQGNIQIQVAASMNYKNILENIKKYNQEKITDLINKLNLQYQQTRKYLGQDPTQQLKQISLKKEKLKNISKQKIDALKNKAQQQINYEYQKLFLLKSKEIQNHISIRTQSELNTIKNQLETNLKNIKQENKILLNNKIANGVQVIKQKNQRDLFEYQMAMHKKLNQIRDKKMNEIIHRSQVSNQDKSYQKIQNIKRIQRSIDNIKKLIKIQTKIFRELNFQKSLSQASNIDQMLKKEMKSLGVLYKAQICEKHRENYKQMLSKYKQDKQYLQSIMNKLQSTRLSYFQNQSSKQTNQYSNKFIKKYNQQVRIMRQNDLMIKQYEKLIKKAEIGDIEAIQALQISNYKFQYKQIETIQQFQSNNEINNYNVPKNERINEILQNQSKYFSNIKSQLNKKIFQLRGLRALHY